MENLPLLFRSSAVCIFLIIFSAAPMFGQPQLPAPLEPQPIQSEYNPAVEEFRQIGLLPPSERLPAYQTFIEKYPGSQLSLRAIREAAIFYILLDTSQSSESLADCVKWIATLLGTPEFGWRRYRLEADSLLLDRIETQLLFVRLLASYATSLLRIEASRSVQLFDRALKDLSRVQDELESRPALYRARPDLLEDIEFARAWSLHGRGDVRAALVAYEEFMEKHPISDYMPGALRNAANCLESLQAEDPDGMRYKRGIYLRRLKEEYGGSPEAAGVRITEF